MNTTFREKYIKLITNGNDFYDLVNDISELSKQDLRLKNEIENINSEILTLNNTLAAEDNEINSVLKDIAILTSEKKRNDEIISNGIKNLDKEICFPKEIEKELNEMTYFNEPALKKELSDNIEKLEDIIKNRVMKIERRHKEYYYVINNPGLIRIHNSVDKEI